MISTAQEDLRKLCKRPGPSGGDYMVFGCKDVHDYLARFSYSPRELEIIRANILKLVAKAEKEGRIPVMTEEGPQWKNRKGR